MFSFLSRTPVISCQELQEAMNSKQEAPVIVDVRETGEWNAGHIDGSINIPLANIQERISKVVPNKGMPVVLCCATGGRSRVAVQILRQLGYTKASNLTGGFYAYQQTIR
ncbi:rhodanese-like domain-containing protein [Patescibacteria group bacterium]|nr:rhodanese-like domain-containing protein [Patescibacteria group bacterium]MBU1721268.1 rhodanese-like domain-containing protein [Patescibacteria group bacterium]MBU1901024.1 rhodanese-like domain-containing protein [Patescibacteria group bacterium]